MKITFVTAGVRCSRRAAEQVSGYQLANPYHPNASSVHPDLSDSKKIQSCGGQVMAGNPRPDSDDGVKANECGLDSNPTPQVSAIKSQYQKMKGDLSMKKFLLTAAATALLGASTAFAQVVVRVAPPPPVVEHRPVSPGARYVWTDGHHRWNGHRYVRVSGRWAV